MLPDVTTSFIARLRARDPAAWFELWELFGPILRHQLARWGGGRIGAETVQDLSQETLAALSHAIDSHDPERGARFSTWLLAIARHTLSGELDRRYAQKRGSGVRPDELQDGITGNGGPGPDDEFEQSVFFAKVEGALRRTERECDFVDFEVWRMRVLDGRNGRDVALAVGVSEPTVSRRLARVREKLRVNLAEVVARFSFTPEEAAEAARNGLEANPNKADDALFDEAVAEIWFRQQALRERLDAEDRAAGGASGAGRPRP